jgi:hypothetical protein
MHRDGADRIIDPNPVEPDDAVHHENAGDEADRVTMAAMAPAAGASVVFIATRPTTSGSAMPKVEPALNPYQPNQRMKTPIMTSGRL